MLISSMNFKFKKKSSLVVFVFILSFLGLNDPVFGSKHSHHHGSMDSKMKSSMKRIHLKKGTKDSLLDVFKMNDNLHQAFFKYNGVDVENAAKRLNDAISRVSDKEISQLLKFSKTKLTEIKASKNREDNNQNYHLVSMALIHILKKYDVGMDFNAFSCPMVKKKWIQNTKREAKVNNPYASEMPLCGSQDSKY